jgi:hypothetical protein
MRPMCDDETVDEVLSGVLRGLVGARGKWPSRTNASWT